MRTRGHNPPSNAGLTPRQKEVMKHFADGLSGLEVAAVLGVSQQAVTEAKNDILLKTGTWFAALSSAYSAQDELPDPDEVIVAVERCRCGLALPCHDCLSGEYLNRHVSQEDNLFVDTVAHSSSAMLPGKEGASGKYND